MTGTLAPRDSKELRQAVEWALNEGVTLDVRGGGSKLSLGTDGSIDFAHVAPSSLHASNFKIG